MAPSPHCTVTLKQYKGHSTRFVNIKIRALLDTGSTHSYVHRRMLPANIILEPVNYTVGNIIKEQVLTVRNVINCNVVVADEDEIAKCRISVIDEVDATADAGIQIRIANSQNCEKLRKRSEFASQKKISCSLRILNTQIRRIAKKFAESSQKVILNFLKKDEFLTILPVYQAIF